MGDQLFLNYKKIWQRGGWLIEWVLLVPTWHYGGFHKWGYPKMDGLWGKIKHDLELYTPIVGTPHMMISALKWLLTLKIWRRSLTWTWEPRRCKDPPEEMATSFWCQILLTSWPPIFAESYLNVHRGNHSQQHMSLLSARWQPGVFLGFTPGKTTWRQEPPPSADMYLEVAS